MTVLNKRIGIIVSPFLAMASLALAMQGCSKMQESFLTVQLCLVDQPGVIQFKNIMYSIATSENLKYIDNSARQRDSLRTMGAEKLLKRDAELAIDVHIEGPGGMGVTAGNLGLPPYQVALGFTEGSNAVEAHRLSERLIRALSLRWHVEQVPQGRGVFPMSNCGG